MAKNIVKSAYKACLINNQTEYGNYVSLSPVSFPGRSFSLDVWFYIEGSSANILAQENGFSLGVESGQLIFSHPSIGTKSIRSDFLKINKREWTNVFVSYDEAGLAFAINGTPVNTLDCPGQQIINTADILVGQGFYGYVRSLRLYKTCIAPEHYKKYLFQTVFTKEDEMPGLLAFTDFTSPSMPDLTPNGVKAKIHNACSVMDLVHVYRPSKGKYASLSQGAHINPGGFESGCFSVYLKTYIRPSVQQRQVLYSNGDLGDEDCVALHTDLDGANYKLCFQHGAASAEFDARLTAYAWYDIIVNYDGKQVSAFINGESDSAETVSISRKGKGDFRLGNGFDARTKNADYTCQHYIFMAGVFDQVLDQKAANDFLQNHPFIFEDNLIALFSFDSGVATEYVGQAEINADSGDLFVAQRTFEDISSEPYQYRLNNTQNTVSSMQEWEAELVYDTLNNFYTEYFGITPAIGADEKTSIINQIAGDEALLESCSALYTEELITGEVVANTISFLPKSALTQIVRMLMPAAMLSAASAAAAAASSTSSSLAGLLSAAFGFASFVGAGIAGAVAAALIIAEAARDSRDDKPDDDDDDDNNDDNGKISLKLLELTFQHNPDKYSESAVRCRDYKGAISAPEWSSAKKETAIAIYIASEIKTVTLKAKIEVKDTREKPASTCTVKLSAYNAVVNEKGFSAFNHLEYTGTLATNKTHEILMTAKDINMPKGSISKCEMELYWTYEIDGKKDTIPNSKCAVYVTPVIPAFPLQLDGKDESMLIYYEFLDFFADSSNKTVSDSRSLTPADLKFLTDRIYNDKRLRYQSGILPFIDKTNCDINGALFVVFTLRTNELMQALGPGGTNIIDLECTAFAAILVYFFWVYSVQAWMVYIQANPLVQPDLSNYESTLHTKLVVPCGSFAGENDFNFHYIVAVENQANLQTPNTLFFDACLGIPGVTGGISSIGFSYTNGNQVQQGDAESYRGTVFKVGTYATICMASLPVGNCMYALRFA